MDIDNKDIETLCGVLLTGTKLQLHYFANLLGFDYKSSSKKAELAGGLSEYMQGVGQMAPLHASAGT